MYLLKSSNRTTLYLTLVFAAFFLVSLGLEHDAFADKVVGTVSLGHYVAGGVAVDPQTNMVYVTNPSNSTVSVINGSSDLVVSTIQVRPYPSNIAVNPFTDKIYVTHPNDGNVTVIDGSNNSVKTIPVPGTPVCIAVNPNINMIYVQQHSYNSVAVIDGSTNKIVHTVVPYSSVYAVWSSCLDVNPSTDRYYMTYGTNPNTHMDSYIAVLDGSYNKYTGTVYMGMSDIPGNFAIDKNTNTVYTLGPAYYNNLNKINGTTNSITSNIVLQQDSGGLSVDPYTHIIYAANHDNNTLYVINGTTLSIKGTIPVGKSPASTAVDPLRDKIYVTNQGDNTVSVVQGSSAPPQITASQLRVNTWDSFGNTRAGLQTELYFQNGTKAATANAPYNFILANGQGYTVHVENNATYIFDHWADTGSTSATRSISITSDSAITAIYRTIPWQPTGLTASSTSPSQVSLGWNTPANNGGAPITSYNVYRSTASGSEILLAQIGNATSYVDSAVTGGQIYYYYVNAVNSVGNSGSSNEQSVAVPSSQASHSVTQAHSGLVASDPLNNATKTQQQLQSSQQYWKYGGDAPSKNAPYSLSEDLQGLHIGVKAPSTGTWAGYYAKTPNTNAILFHGIITTPRQTIPDYNGFYQNGLYVDTPAQTNYLSCGSDTSLFGTSWAVISVTGNSSSSTPYNVLWTDYNTNHPIRDCTIITNGLNYLKAYIDGNVVYQSSNLNLQMSSPFNAYLRTETSYAGQLLNGTYNDFYATSGENVIVSTNLSGASTVAIVNSTGGILASAPVIGGAAVMPIGKYDMPLYANVSVYDSKGMEMTTTPSPLDIYGGDAFSTSSSPTGMTPQPPTGLTADAISSSKINLAWNVDSNNGGSPITNYKIYKSTTSGSELYFAAVGNATSYADTAVTGGNTYFYKITAVNSIGESSLSNEASATPQPPAGVTVKSVDANNNPIYGIFTLLCSQGTSTYANGSNTCETGQSRYGSGYTTVTFGEIQGQTFGVEVYNNATCSFSHWSDNTQNVYRFRLFTATSPPVILTAVYNCGTAQTTPSAPTGLAATPGNAQVSLSWTIPSSNGGSAITGYDIYRGTTSRSESSTPIATGITTTSYSDTSVTNGQTYYYYVTAVNSIGTSSPSNEASATPTAPIPAQATISVNSADLCGNPLKGLWTIARYTNGSTATQGYTPASFQLPTKTTYVVHVGNYGSDVFNHWMNGNTTSYYTITLTQNANLTAYYSTGSTCTSPTATAPGSPTGLAATAASTSQINLSWTAPSSNGGSAITGYKIERSADSGTSWSAIQSNTGSTSTTYSDTGLAASTAYTYRVSAINSVGTSLPSSTATATTLASTPPPTAPSAPTGLTATAGNAQVSLSWTAPSSNGGSTITGYNVYRGIASGGESTTPLTTVTSTSYNDTGLTNGQTYYYTVKAVNSAGTGSASNEASAAPTAPATTGIALNNVQSTSGTTSSSNQVTISGFNVGASSNQMLLVGISANNNAATSVTFGGVQLQKATSSFTNNDAEFWYLKNPTGTGSIVVTFGGPTQAVVGAYSLANVNQTAPIATTASNHNTAASSPAISVTTKHANDWVLDLPSIYGGQKLGSPTCTQEWNTNIPSAITGTSSSTTVSSPSTATCGWTASNGGDLWDDVAVEIKATG